MAENAPQKADINAIFKRLRSIPTNKQCFDCNANNPTWASVTYGVFLCIDCSAVHRSLGVHLTFIRSTQLDTSWTWLQLRAMQVGGNANATVFFRQHGCTTNDAQQKYNSRAAHMYREKLHALSSRAMQTHGTKLHIDAQEMAASPPASQKEVDFFHEQENGFDSIALTKGQSLFSEPVSISNGKTKPSPDESGEGPNVEAALSMSPTAAATMAEPRKSTITGRKKPASAKKGLGGKKGGFGAQKVKTNFSDVEAMAQARDQEKETLAAQAETQKIRTKEDREKQEASMRLAYQDLTLESKKRDDKMKNMDPRKAEQMERLGMGASGPRGVTHSVMSDMKVIEQETPTLANDRNMSSRWRDDDDFEMVGNSFSGPPKYSDSPFGIRKEDRYGWGNTSSNSSSSNNKHSAWSDLDSMDNKHSPAFEDMPSRNEDEGRGRSRKNYSDAPSSEEAQKKFGNAKAISSDQFFGNKDPDFETRQKLSGFEGSQSISSADLFGNGQSHARHDDYGGTDLSDIKEGVRQGVTKVAGKLSTLANGMITSIQILDHQRCTSGKAARASLEFVDPELSSHIGKLWIENLASST